MISAKNGRPPPPIPPRPSKQVVAEALAKTRPPKPINNVSQIIDRTEKNIGNYINHQVIKKREELLNAKNNKNNPSLVAWGGTVIYRSPSFIRDEENRKLEEAKEQKLNKNNTNSVIDEPAKICNVDPSKIPKPKSGNPNVAALSVAKNLGKNCSLEKNEDDVKNNMNNINDMLKCPSVKDIIRSLREEKIKNVDIAANTSRYENSNAITSKSSKTEVDFRVNNSQQEINVSSVNLNRSDIAQNETYTKFKRSDVFDDCSKLIPQSINDQLTIFKEFDSKNTTETERKATINNLHNIEVNNKDLLVKTSITKVAIAPDCSSQLNATEETRVVIGSGASSSTLVSANVVPTTTTTIEIRDGQSTASSIISNTISNSVQITLCCAESSRSFGDTSLSVRPEPEGGETEKPDIEKPRLTSSPPLKKSGTCFNDIANHELLISELQDMKQEQRIRKRQRQPDQEDSKVHVDSSADQKSEASTLDDRDLDSISTSDWTEISNDGAETIFSSCCITLDSTDTDVVNSRERRDSGNSSSNSESPSISRMSASLPPGLPPLPKSLSGFELRAGSGGSQPQSRPPPPEPPRTSRPQATLDTQLAVLRREMVSVSFLH